MEAIKKKIRPFKKRLSLYIKVNWLATLYFNFKIFPFEIAMKLPVIFYGSIKFSDLSGSVSIQAPIKMGMIGIGQRFEKMTRSRGIAEISLLGNLVFKGHAHIGLDCFIHVGKEAYCEFGHMGCLGSNVKLICTEKIIIGNWAGIGYESQLVDTNSHPMMDKENNEYFPMGAPIIIGNYNSFSNRITVLPGTITPDNCVIASNSLCNRDYSPFGNYILIGGVPAKLLKQNYMRDWESEKEMLIRNKIIW